MDAKLIQDLVDVGSGKLRHAYMGQCPDGIEGSAVRDRSCPACKVLLAGAAAAKALRASERKARPEPGGLARAAALRKGSVPAFQLPAGWTREEPPHSKHCVVFNAPGGADMVTVDFDQRLFRLGYSFSGAKDSRHAYIGRGWRDELCADAVKSLVHAIQPIAQKEGTTR